LDAPFLVAAKFEAFDLAHQVFVPSKWSVRIDFQAAEFQSDNGDALKSSLPSRNQVVANFQSSLRVK
jgi:hypothetical protein